MMSLYIVLSSALILCRGTSSSTTQHNKPGTCKAPDLENGRHVPNKIWFDVGEWLQYDCDEGYMTAQRNLVESVQCLSTGWSTLPQCSGITCSFQPKPGFDKIHLVYSNGQVSKFSCNDGFTLKGSASSQCYYYGWDPPLPTCQASGEKIKCQPPPQPMNIQDMTLKSDYFNGDKEIIRCKPGFQLHGAQTIICKNGQWTSPPQCVRSHDCEDPPSISFGTLDPATVKSKYPSGSIVRYECNGGLEISGEQDIICINGKWSAPPVCMRDSDNCQLSMDKITQNNLLLSKSISTKKVFKNGDRILTRCKHMYFRASPSSILECINGKMIYPKCTQEKPCRINQEKLDENFLELHPDYDYKVFFEDKEVIHFMCKAGYMTTETGTGPTGLCIKEDIIYPVCYKI